MFCHVALRNKGNKQYMNCYYENMFNSDKKDVHIVHNVLKR